MTNPLGKGLESLIPESTPEESEERQPLEVLDMQASLREPVYRMARTAFPAPDASLPKTAHPVAAAAASGLAKRSISDPPSFSESESSKYIRAKGESVFSIDISKIEPNPYQPRREFDEAALKNLADSIRVHGVLQPVVVSKAEVETPRGLDVRYQLIAGERRWRASKLAGLREIPAIVKRDRPPERQKLEWALIENVQREDLNALERARAFRQLTNDFKLAQREVAERIGKSREYVANAVRLLSLAPEMQSALERGSISEGHARALLTLQDLPESQKKLFGEITANNLSVRDAELATRAILGIKRPTKRRNALFMDPEIRSAQAQLEESLGTKVLLQKDGTRGKIIVEFYSDEELQHILGKIIREA